MYIYVLYEMCVCVCVRSIIIPYANYGRPPPPYNNNAPRLQRAVRQEDRCLFTVPRTRVDDVLRAYAAAAAATARVCLSLLYKYTYLFRSFCVQGDSPRTVLTDVYFFFHLIIINCSNFDFWNFRIPYLHKNRIISEVCFSLLKEYPMEMQSICFLKWKPLFYCELSNRKCWCTEIKMRASSFLVIRLCVL
jgi:hypothetical protein